VGPLVYGLGRNGRFVARTGREKFNRRQAGIQGPGKHIRLRQAGI